MAMQQKAFNLRDILEIVFTRKWFFVFTFIPVFTGAILISFTLPKKYRSGCVLEVQTGSLTNMGPVSGEAGRKILQIYAQRIRSTTQMELVVKKLGLDKKVKDFDDFVNLVESFKYRTGVNIRTDNVLHISHDHKNPIKAKEILETIVDSFVEEDRINQENKISSSVDFVKHQLDLYQEKLRESEVALRKIKFANMPDMSNAQGSSLGVVTSLSGNMDTSVDRLIRLQMALLEVEKSVVEVQNEYILIKEELSKQGKTVLSRFIKEDSNAAALQNKLNSLKSDLNERFLDCTEDHPIVKGLQMRIERTEKRFAKEVQRLVSSKRITVNPAYKELESKISMTKNKLDSLRNQKNELNSLVNVYRERVELTPDEEQVELFRLVRDTRVNEGIYSMLLKKLEDTKIAQQLELGARMTRFKMLDPPRVPREPLKRGQQKCILFGLMLAIFAGSGLVYVIELFDNSFKGVDDASSELELPILGSIPAVKKKQ